MFKKIIIGLCVASLLFMTAGCGFKDYNTQLSIQNAQRFNAFATGINSATSEGARIAIAMAFAGNMGNQKLAKPETVRDYIHAVAPYITPLYTLFNKKEEQSIAAGRDIYMNSTRKDTFSLTNSSTVSALGTSNTTSGSYTPDNSVYSAVPEQNNEDLD